MASDKGNTIETVRAEVDRLGSLLSKQAQQIISMSARLYDLELLLGGKIDLELRSEAVRIRAKGKGGKGKGKGKGANYDSTQPDGDRQT